MGSIGETLRQARIDKGVTLAEAERSTFVRRRYLEALEADDFGSLPAQVYTRGFIRTYAEYLGLNPETILDLYQPPRGRESAPRLRATAPTSSRPRSVPVAWLTVIGGAILAVLLLWYLRAQYYSFNESLQRAQTTQLPSRVNQPSPTGIVQGIVARTSVAEAPTPRLATPTAAPIEGVQVDLKLSDSSWLEVWVDGEQQLAEVAKSGDKKSFHASNRVRLRVADAGALAVVVNGEAQPALGSSGQAVEASWER